jgi:CBS domain-containing protein
MTTEVVTVDPETEVFDVARVLLAHRISAAPVVDSGGCVLGMVSEGDLMRRAECGPGRKWWLSLVADKTAEFVRTHGTRARDVMTRDVVTIDREAALAEIVRTLEGRGTKRVPVVEDGRLLGIVSRADVLRGLATLAVAGDNIAASPNDRLLRERILDLIKRKTAVSPHAVSVIVVGRRVYLWGVTDTPEEREAVRVAAETVAGTGNVHDYLNTLPQVLRGL